MKPSVTTTSAVAGGQVAALDVADELDPLGAGEDLVGGDHLLTPLAGLLADREQADARSLDPEHGRAEGGAEEGELDQVLSAHLDVGADVEKEHLLAGNRQLHRQRRSLYALDPPQAEGGRSHRRPGRAGADHRRRSSLGDVGGSAHDRGALLRPHRPHRVLVVADPLSGWHDLDTRGAIESELRGRPEHAHSDPVRSRKPCPLREHSKALLGPETIQGDGDALRHDYSVSGEAAVVGSAIVCLITSRPA